MKIRYFTVSFFVIFFFWINLSAQTVETRGRLSNSVYVFERSAEDSGDESNQVARIYQFIRFTARIPEYKNLSFHFSGRALTDTKESLESEERFRAYRLSLSASELFNGILDLEIGRQFLHAGIPFGSLDGVNAKLRFSKNLEWQVYGGVETHLQRSLEVYEIDDATVFGSSLKYRNIYDNDLQLAYLHKRSNDEDQWQILGLNVSNRSIKSLSMLLQAHYDLINEQLHRLYFSSRYSISNSLTAYLSLKQQYPQIFGGSFFRIFEFDAYQQGTFGVGYAISKDYTVGANYTLIQVEEGSGNRFIANLSNRNGSIGVIYESGDLGDQLGLLFDYGYEIFPNLLLSLSIDYSRYRFEKIYEYENQLANAVRVSYSFSRHLKTDLEYQWLNNRFKDSDQRLLNHIHYIW
jgi:hypothetical protein